MAGIALRVSGLYRFRPACAQAVPPSRAAWVCAPCHPLAAIPPCPLSCPASMPSVSELTVSGLLPHLVRGESGWTATWRALTLHSVFQPVLSVTHQCVVGYEGLLRAFDPVGLPVSPEVLFSGTRSANTMSDAPSIPPW